MTHNTQAQRLPQHPQAMALLRDPRLWTGRHRSRLQTVASGHAELDLSLPGGGWPVGTLTEILHGEHGIGEMQLLLPALARLSRSKHIAMIAPPFVVNAPALSSVGAQLSRITVLPQVNDSERNWAAEQCLRSGAYAAVLIWAEQMPDRELRRLQLACEQGRALGFMFRNSSYAQQPSAAGLRLQLGPQGQIDILKSRGGRPQRLWWQRARTNTRHAVDLPVSAPLAAGCPA